MKRMCSKMNEYDNPSVSFEDAVNMNSDCCINFEQYGKEDHYGTKSFYPKSNTDPYDGDQLDTMSTIRASTIVRQYQTYKPGFFPTSTDILNDACSSATDYEITRSLRRIGMEAENPCYKPCSKTTNKLLKDDRIEMYGMEGTYLDDNFFKLERKSKEKNVIPATKSAVDVTKDTIMPSANFVLENMKNPMENISNNATCKYSRKYIKSKSENKLMSSNTFAKTTGSKKKNKNESNNNLLNQTYEIISE